MTPACGNVTASALSPNKTLVQISFDNGARQTKYLEEVWNGITSMLRKKLK